MSKIVMHLRQALTTMREEKLYSAMYVACTALAIAFTMINLLPDSGLQGTRRRLHLQQPCRPPLVRQLRHPLPHRLRVRVPYYIRHRAHRNGYPGVEDKQE